MEERRMNGGHAFQTIEDTGSASFHADFRSLRGELGAPSEPPPSSGRSEASTRPCADPFADTMASPASFASDHPHWCVDVGEALLSMTTFELWEGLERGQVTAWMRVWREGMECWTPVGEIAEFTWAIAGTPDPTRPPEPAPEPEPPAEARTDPPHAPTALVEPPPVSTIRPVTPLAHHDLGGARWIALGSAVAVAAVVAAIFAHSDPPQAPPAPIAGATPAALRLEDAPGPRLEDAPAPEAAHHEERGQHRLPRDGRRAYGR
jgi:GYF domain 2